MVPKDNSRLKPLMQSQNLSLDQVLWECKIEAEMKTTYVKLTTDQFKGIYSKSLTLD